MEKGMEVESWFNNQE